MEGGLLPTRGSDGAAGYDLYSPTDYVMQSWRMLRQRHRIMLKLCVAIPLGHYGQILGRSSMANAGILAHTGVIDEDYRGEVGIILFNMSDDTYRISRGDRIGQLVLCPYRRELLVEVDQLPSTVRGARGFGSTGK